MVRPGYGRRASDVGEEERPRDGVAGLDAVAVGERQQGVGPGHGGELVGALAARPSGRGARRRRRARRRPGRSGSCRRAARGTARRRRPGPPGAAARRARPSGAAPGGRTARSTPSTTPGCRGGRTPGVPSTRPKANGLAGRIAICIQRMSPMRSSTTLTKSKSPMDTPPLVSMASQVAAPSLDGRGDGGLVVGDQAEVDGLPARLRDQGEERRRFESRIWPGRRAARPPRPARRRWRARRPAAGGARAPRPRRCWPARRGGRRRAPRPARTPRRRRARRRRPAAPPRPTGTAASMADPRAVVEPARALDHHDGVGAGGHRRAGHDPHRLARPERPIGGMPGRHLGDHRQLDRRAGVAPATSAARTAKPSIAVLANGGTSSGDAPSRRARTRPPRRSTSPRLSGATRSSTCAARRQRDQHAPSLRTRRAAVEASREHRELAPGGACTQPGLAVEDGISRCLFGRSR